MSSSKQLAVYVMNSSEEDYAQGSAPHPACTNSVVQWYGVQETNSCGYCSSKRPGRVSAGMVASKLTVYAYQELLDRGWRRSGTYLYLTYPDRNCCPTYTIRLHAPSFRPSAAQKKSLRRFDQFLSGEWATKQQKRARQQQQCGAVNKSTYNVEEQHTCDAARADAGDSAVVGDQQLFLEHGPAPASIDRAPNRPSVDFNEDVACQDNAAPTTSTFDEELGPDSLRSAAKAFAKHCNATFFAAANTEAPVAIQNILVSSDDVMFTVKWTSLDSGVAKPAEVVVDRDAEGANDLPNFSMQTVHLQSSMCWKAAAKYHGTRDSAPGLPLDGIKPALACAMGTAAVPSTGVASAVGDQSAPQLSKKKAKKAAKAAAKAAAAGKATTAAVSHPPTKKSVSCIAQELAEAIRQTLTQALENDELLSALAPVATCERGHMHVTLRVPSVSQLQDASGAEEELKNFLEAARCSSNKPPPQHAAVRPAALDQNPDTPQTLSLTSIAAASSALQDAHALCVSQEAACMHEASDVGANSDACTDDSGSGANSDSYCSQDSGNSNEPSCDLEGVKEHTQGLKDGHMHDDTGIEPHKWWLDAPPTGGWQFRTEWQPSSFVEKEYQLYRKYQIAVHNDCPSKLSRSGYTKFLVHNPFGGGVSQAEDPRAPECGYGAFHVQWWLGEHLVALCVVDVLPRCLSSKYFIWDPDLHFLSLGRVSVLKEIEWVQHAHSSCSTPEKGYHMDTVSEQSSGTRQGNPLQFSYLGLYIHSNQKMRYKAEYRTSELLCRNTLRWVPTTPALLKQLDTHDGTPFLAALHPPVPHRDPLIPPWSLRHNINGLPTRKCAAGNGASAMNRSHGSNSKKRDISTRSSDGMKDAVQSTSQSCTREDRMHEADAPGEATGSDVFEVGDIKASIGDHVLSVQEWLVVLRPSVTSRLQALTDEFLENVGPEIAAVCVLDL